MGGASIEITPGGSLGLEVGTHVRQQNRVKGCVFLHGAGCSKFAKRGAFSKVVLQRVLFLNLGQKSRTNGYILSSQNLKRVQFSPPVTTRKGSNFEKHVLTWVPSSIETK
jgi:hypothetical protein